MTPRANNKKGRDDARWPRERPGRRQGSHRASSKATRDPARARMKGETLDVEYLRGQINELNFMDGIVLILLDKQKRAASAASA